MISLSNIRLMVDLKAKDEEYLKFLRTLAISQLETGAGKSFTLRLAYEQMYYSVRYQNMLQLKLLPVVALTKLEHREESTQTWTEIVATAYNYTKPRTITLLTGTFKDQVKVTYDFGYDETTLPERIKTALMVQIRYLNQRMDPAKIDIKIKAVQGDSTTYMSGEYHPIFKSLLKSLKNG